MAKITFRDGKLAIPETPRPIGLPDDLSKEFLTCCFEALPYEPQHVARVHEIIDWSEKERFRLACQAGGEALYEAWSAAALDWASILNEDNHWNPKTINLCWIQKIDSHLVKSIAISETGVIFVDSTDMGLLTEAEFQYHYGSSFATHLDEWVEYVTNLIAHVKTIIADELTERDVTLAQPDGEIVTEKRIGPRLLGPKYWSYGDGFTYLDEG